MERHMSKPCTRLAWAMAPAGLLLIASAAADVYTWVDAKGNVNVSNLKPPEGVRVTHVAREDPEAAARAEAARTAAREAEVRKLSERVAELERTADDPARGAPLLPPYPVAPPSPPQLTQFVVTVMPPEPQQPDYGPQYGPYAACGAFDCYAPWGLGYYGVPVVVVGSNFGRNGHNHVRQRPRPQPLPQAMPVARGVAMSPAAGAARGARRG
jgi:hypothetical protein